MRRVQSMKRLLFPIFHSLSVRLSFAYLEFTVHSFALLAQRVGIRKVDIMRSVSPPPTTPQKLSPNYKCTIVILACNTTTTAHY